MRDESRFGDGVLVRKARLITGIVLMVFVTTHFINHSLGLISLETMEAGRDWFLVLWRNPIGTVILYVSLLIHFLLAIWALYARRHLSMSIPEFLQYGLGIAIPLLLATHIVGTRGAHEVAGTNDIYAYVLLVHWKYSRASIAYQTAGLLVTWIHGCIGLHYWMRLKPWYGHIKPIMFGAGIMLPVLAFLGYAQAGKDVLALANDPDWLRQALKTIQWPKRAAFGTLKMVMDGIKVTVIAGFALALIARMIRSVVEKRRGAIQITYPGGRMVSTVPGNSILDVSREFKIPHASVCGGRGRCSTCRVRIVEGLQSLSRPSAEEEQVLKRIGSPLNVRLACQTRPDSDISLVLLLPPDASPKDARGKTSQQNGQEMEIAVLFSDLRSFTQFSEKKLPYDVVFVLNRYFAEMGQAIEGAGGKLDKFIGDGVMALFGTDRDIREACRGAILAARRMVENLNKLNGSLANELGEPLRIGIGIHAGPGIVGEMGYGDANQLTAIGDTVNIASRLETMNKELGSQVVISDDVCRYAGVEFRDFPSKEIEVRGRSEPIRIHVISNAEDLPIDSI
jgi:adenylate cyclase